MTTTPVDRNHTQRLIVAFSRVSLYLLILVVSQISFIVQKSFINWSLIAPFYFVICVALSFHVVYVHFLDWLSEHRWVHFAGFVLDSLLLSLLINYSGVNQSLFLFLHLVNILLAGLVFQSRGALTIALFSSIFFTTASLFGPEVRGLNYVFILVLNDIAFFSVAALSGYLSEQLQFMGVELTKTGLNLQEIQELNKAIVSHMPSGLMTYTQNGQILQDNLAAQEILETANLLDQNIFKWLPALQKSAQLHQDLVWASPSGVKKSLRLNVSSVFSPAVQAEVFIAQLEDLTRVRELEYSLRQNEKMAAIGGLAAGIAHEIRNPLASISGSIELLSQTTANDDDRRLMKIILKEIDRLNHLITEFLDYSRPEQPPSDPVDLVSLLNEVLEDMRLNKQLRKDIELNVKVPAKAVILGRRDKLKQAFLNIILNSFQAMETSPQAQFEVKLEYDKAHWRLQLRDTGCGMSEATRVRMFEPFHTTKIKGTGLGLAITHKILEGHRAQIFVESTTGVGTTFTLSFPAVQS